MRRSFSRFCVVVLSCSTAFAESRCVGVKPPRSAYGESITLLPSTKAIEPVVEAAIEMWRNCQRLGAGMPALLVGEGGARQIEVVYIAGSSGSRRCGAFAGSTVTLYLSAIDHEGRPVRCGDPARTMAHELGHVFGLDDQYDPVCNRHIMSPVPPRRADRRYPTPAECRAVAERWAAGAPIRDR